MKTLKNIALAAAVALGLSACAQPYERPVLTDWAGCNEIKTPQYQVDNCHKTATQLYYDRLDGKDGGGE